MDLKNHWMKSTTVSINRDLNETWIIFTDGAFEQTNTQPASIGGILPNPSDKVVSYFGYYISGSLLNVFLKSQDTQYMNSKYFQWSLRSERGRNLSWENW